MGSITHFNTTMSPRLNSGFHRLKNSPYHRKRGEALRRSSRTRSDFRLVSGLNVGFDGKAKLSDRAATTHYTVKSQYVIPADLHAATPDMLYSSHVCLEYQDRRYPV